MKTLITMATPRLESMVDSSCPEYRGRLSSLTSWWIEQQNMQLVSKFGDHLNSIPRPNLQPTHFESTAEQRGRRNSQSVVLCYKIVGVILLGSVLMISNVMIVDTISPKSLRASFVFGNENKKMDVDHATTMNHEHESVVADHQGWILQRMEQEGSSLELSRLQQASFQAKVPLLHDIFPKRRRFRSLLSLWGANIVTDRYAYIHIFKNGGTTIAAQTGRDHVPIHSREVLRRKWFTLVRDPIAHFLSGWSECGNRQRQGQLRNNAKRKKTKSSSHQEDLFSKQLLLDYDERIQQWLLQVKEKAKPGQPFVCETHSFPQVNSMFGIGTSRIPPNLEIVGDLQELPALLKLIGFEYNPALKTGRNATSNAFLRTHYPRRVDLLSNKTIRDLCDFLAIDYFLLDYPLPSACKDMPPTGYTTWTMTTNTTAGAAAKSTKKSEKSLKRLQNRRYDRRKSRVILAKNLSRVPVRRKSSMNTVTLFA